MGGREDRQRNELTMCCQKGKVHVPPFSEPPEELRQMICNTQHPLHKELMKNINNYNNGFAVASVVAETVAVGGNGPPVYKIHGQMYHHLSSLYTNERPCFGQYFILDTDDALNERMSNPYNRECKREVRSYQYE